MDFDGIVNKLVAMFRNGEFPGWTMTDDDCAQLRRDIRSGKYEFVDIGLKRTGFKTDVAVFHGIIDLDDYTHEELWEIGQMYYETEEEFFGQGDAIVAECVFENESESYWGGEEIILKTYLDIVKGASSNEGMV